MQYEHRPTAAFVVFRLAKEVVKAYSNERTMLAPADTASCRRYEDNEKRVFAPIRRQPRTENPKRSDHG